ncbi:MAG TPA: DUF6607 family protein [Cyclobacteriaceae bacterium]
MKRTLFLCALICTLNLSAQDKKAQDKAAIKAMCGCYDIDFQFAETFSSDRDYEFHDNYLAGGLEYAFVVDETEDKIVIQHLLVINDSTIVKHWRQDWIYENTELYAFDKNAAWNYVSLPKDAVRGQWTQKVYQVDDSPRYEGTATWVHFDGRHYWESTADAPLPRREFSKRSDYNVLERRNHHEVFDEYWVHEQDNKKLIRAENVDDKVIASEKGMNVYNKVDKEKCQPAVDWWTKNSDYWAVVRNVWDEVFATQKRLELNMKVEDQILFQRLFALGGKYEGKEFNEKKVKKEIKEAIQKHLATEAIKLAMN